MISPYVVKAIGARAARWLFLSAESISSQRAQELQLIHYSVPEENLLSFTFDKAKNFTKHAPKAMTDTKKLINLVLETSDALKLQQLTAQLIAKKRKSTEAQQGISAVLNKTSPMWG